MMGLAVNRSLVSLVDETANIERALLESGGEITPFIEALLETKDIHLPDKVDRYSLVMDRMESIAAFYKSKAEMFLRLAKAAANVEARCEANLKFAMQANGTDEICGFDVRYKLVNSNPACVVDDETAIDASYKITETITKLDKKRMVEDMKLGVPIEGAHLEQGQSLRRYINSPAKKLK